MLTTKQVSQQEPDVSPEAVVANVLRHSAHIVIVAGLVANEHILVQLVRLDLLYLVFRKEARHDHGNAMKFSTRIWTRIKNHE